MNIWNILTGIWLILPSAGYAATFAAKQKTYGLLINLKLHQRLLSMVEVHRVDCCQMRESPGV